MTVKHTPGPWTVRDVSWSDDGYACFEVLPIKQVGIADARLIAAAPEMLEALRLLAEGWRNGLIPASTWGVAFVTIAKAEGRE